MPGAPLHVRDRLRIVIPAAAIVGLALTFAADGIWSYFTPDDMMNLYGAWFRPLREADRPLGALYYRAVFAFAGLNQLPFRAGCFVLLFANLALLYRFCRVLSGSREIALLACLMGAYHAHLADLYYSTGTVYDLLCFTLYFAAFTQYAATRRAGRPFGWGGSALVVGLYAGALYAKEMAVTLPLFLLLYEFVYYPPKPAAAIPRWAIDRLLLVWLTGGITLAVVLRKLAGPDAMTRNPEYFPHFSWQAFAAGCKHYLGDLFYGAIHPGPAAVAAIWLVLLAAAVLARRRAMLFAWLFMLFAMLPVIFITPRGFFAVYLALPGWYLFAACGLVRLRDAVLRPGGDERRVWGARQAHVATFAIVMGILAPLHDHEKPAGNGWVPEAHRWVRSVLQPISAQPAGMPPGAKVLFLTDPYPVEDWILTFIFRLRYRDDQIRVDRAKLMHAPPDPGGYDRVFRLDNWRLEAQPQLNAVSDQDDLTTAR